MKKIKIFLVSLSLIACSSFAFAMENQEQTQEQTQELTQEEINTNFNLLQEEESQEEINTNLMQEEKSQEEESQEKINTNFNLLQEEKSQEEILNYLTEENFIDAIREEDKNIEEDVIKKATELFLKKIKKEEFLNEAKNPLNNYINILSHQKIEGENFTYYFTVELYKLGNLGEQNNPFSLIVSVEKQKNNLKEEKLKEEKKEEKKEEILNCLTIENFLNEIEKKDMSIEESVIGKALTLFFNKQNSKEFLNKAIAAHDNEKINILNEQEIDGENFTYLFTVNFVKLSNGESNSRPILDIHIKKQNIDLEYKKNKEKILNYLTKEKFIETIRKEDKSIEEEVIEKATNLFLEKINQKNFLNKAIAAHDNEKINILNEQKLEGKNFTYSFTVDFLKLSNDAANNCQVLNVSINKQNNDLENKKKILNYLTKETFIDAIPEKEEEKGIEKSVIEKATEVFLEKVKQEEFLNKAINPNNSCINILKFHEIEDGKFQYYFTVNFHKLADSKAENAQFFLSVSVEKQINESEEEKERILNCLTKENFIDTIRKEYKDIEKEVIEKATKLFLEKVKQKDFLNKAMAKSNYVPMDILNEEKIEGENFTYSFKVQFVKFSNDEFGFNPFLNISVDKQQNISKYKKKGKKEEILSFLTKENFQNEIKKAKNGNDIEQGVMNRITDLFLEKTNKKKLFNELIYAHNGKKVNIFNNKEITSNEFIYKFTVNFYTYLDYNYKYHPFLEIDIKKQNNKSEYENKNKNFNFLTIDNILGKMEEEEFLEKKQKVLKYLTKYNFLKAIHQKKESKDIKEEIIEKAANSFLKKVNQEEFLKKVIAEAENEKANIFNCSVEDYDFTYSFAVNFQILTNIESFFLDVDIKKTNA